MKTIQQFFALFFLSLLGLCAMDIRAGLPVLIAGIFFYVASTATITAYAVVLRKKTITQMMYD